MDLPMAAKKTRKPSKKPRTKATPSGKRASGKRASAKRTPPKAVKKRVQAKAKVKKTVAKAKPRLAKRRPAPAKTVKSAKKGAPKRPLARKQARKAPAEKAPKKKNLLRKSERVAPEPTRSRSRAVIEARLEKGPEKKREKSVPPPAPSAKKTRLPDPRGSQAGGPLAAGGGKQVPAARRSSPGKSPTGKPPAKERPSLRGQGRAPLREAPPRLVALPLPIMVAPRRPSVEERAVLVESRLGGQTDDFRKNYEERLDMSWIFHDSALEGVVYTFEELRTALSGQAPPVTDSSLQPTYDDIRRHKEAIEFVRDYGMRKKLPVTVDIIKKIYLILHPEEGDIKTVKYRKDIPQHRLYFHEYAPPDKIAYKVRQIVDWLNDPETRKTRNGVRIAARAHYDLLRVYPFPTDSGKVSRLFMNLMLMRSGLPPAIVHSTERQRYYEALKGSATTVLQMVQEAVENALSSVEKLLDEHETRKRAFVS